MIINKNDPSLKLYSTTHDLKKEPMVVESWATNMISMINETTTITQFEDAWKNNPNYKLEMKGSYRRCHGETGLHMSVSKNNLEMTKFFIKHLSVGNIDSLNSSRRTPLHEALLKRKNMRHSINLEVIRQLLIAGADVNLGWGDTRWDGFESSPLLHALKPFDLELTKLLLQFGAQKLVAFTPDKKALIKQKFDDKQNEIYKQAKNEIKIQKDARNLFILGRLDEKSTLNCFPTEIIAYILMSNRIHSSNDHRIIEAKRMIEQNKRQTLMNEKVNSGNTLTIANY
ncbi:MAG: ankyrin repeat domain-containing protein [Nitrosopumilus sp.]|nr:ankyrin repeat domain-containing protein [Nitrosopumilus sp.]